MPPSESLRTLDDVDEYIQARRDAGARRRADHRRGLLEADFFWSDPPPPAHRGDVTAPADIGASPDIERSPVPADPGRRTIVITGRGAERPVSSRRGYEARLHPHERSGFKPDRVAMWAVLLCVALLLGAVTSSHAAVLHAAALHLR